MKEYLWIIMCISYIYGFVWIITLITNYQRAKKSFVSILTNKLQAGQIKDKKDLLIICNSINRKFGIKYSLITYLEDYLTFKIDLDNENKLLLSRILNLEIIEQPFHDVAEEEKILLTNILHSENINVNIINNLHRLGAILATKNRIYKRNEKINRLSVPFAIVGFLATVGFGYLSLKPVDYHKIKEINKEIWQEIYINRTDSI